MEKESAKAKHPVGELSIPRTEMLRGNHPHQGGYRPNQSHGFDLPVLRLTNHSSHLKIE